MTAPQTAEPESLLEVADGVAVFTLNRPAKMNAISQSMFDNDLPQMVDRVEKDRSIRALVITGAGGNFCAGADVTRMSSGVSRTPEERTESLRRTLGVLYRLINLDRPVIAAVDGIAFGGGFSIALTADIVLASTRARFSLVFGRIGLIPDMTIAYTLPRIVGPQRAKELAFTARSIEAEEAKSMGIVHALHEPDGLLPAAKEMAARLARGSATSMAQAKRLIDMSLNATPAEMTDAECAAQVACRDTDFHHEAVRRFLNKEPRLYDWDAMTREAAKGKAAE